MLEGDYVSLTEFEVFQALEELADAAVERCFENPLDALPNRDWESRTLLKVRLLLAEKKIAKYESEITRLMDFNRDAGIELAKAITNGNGFVELPHVTKRKIRDLSSQIELIKDEAKRFGLRFGWNLVGGVEPETGEYRFQKITLRQAFCERRAG